MFLSENQILPCDNTNECIISLSFVVENKIRDHVFVMESVLLASIEHTNLTSEQQFKDIQTDCEFSDGKLEKNICEFSI